MARLKRICPAGIPQHLIQRGNNRQICFRADKDFAVYAYWLRKSSVKYGVAVHAWAFMTNHVHLLVTPTSDDSVSRMMQFVGGRYVPYFNHAHKRTGTLWEGRYKSCVVEAERYLLLCQRYIELNPVRAGMVKSPSEYPWSSYRPNALGMKTRLWSPHEIYLGLGKSEADRLIAYQSLFESHIDQRSLNYIRESVNKGLALGDGPFKDEIKRRTGRRVIPGKRGPRKSKNLNLGSE